MYEILKNFMIVLIKCGDVAILKDLIERCKIQKPLIEHVLNSLEWSLCKDLIRHKKYEMMFYLLSLNLKVKMILEEKLIMFALECDEIKMAETLRDHKLMMEFHRYYEFDTLLELIKKPEILKFCKSCPPKLSEDGIITRYVLESQDVKTIDLLHHEFKIDFNDEDCQREIDRMCREYIINKPKIIWYVTHYAKPSRDCWKSNSIYVHILDENPGDVGCFLKRFTLKFALEMIFYCCAYDMKTSYICENMNCASPVYIYGKEAGNAWRLAKNSQEKYYLAVLELLFQTGKIRVGPDLKKHIGKFLCAPRA